MTQPPHQPATTTIPRAGQPVLPDLTVGRAADKRTLAAVLITGVAFDIAVRAGIVGVGGALFIAAAATGLALTRHDDNDDVDPTSTTHSRALACAAAVFGLLLAVRTSPWLVGPNLIAAAGLLGLSASLASGGHVMRISLADVLMRAAAAAGHLVAAPAFLRTARRPHRPDSTTTTTTRAGVARGLALAAPIVALLAALLASADPVFASIFRFPSSAGDLVAHTVIVGIGAWGAAGLLRTASATPPPPVEPATFRIGRTETLVLLGSLVALFAAFGTTQLVTALGGARHVLEQNGLTFASYAREGFFQLLAVAAITAAVLAAVRAFSDIDRATLVLAETAVALTIAIVWIALRKLGLYERAYGLTMLRLYSQAAAVWIALVFVLLGVALTKESRPRWMLPGAATIAVALLLLLNAVNPEALVVRRNSRHAEPDLAYLATLSDDAVPALAKAGLPVPCNAQDDPQHEPHKGWAAANWSRSRANAVRERPGVCQP